MTRIGFNQDQLAPYARPGHWNDPDMLEIGNGGMTDTEYRTHMSLWSMLAAPLIAGNDLRDTPAFDTRDSDQPRGDRDRSGQGGKAGRRVWKSGDQEIWSRELAGGDWAVAIFNRATEPTKLTFKWVDAGIQKIPAHARDLWNHTDLKLPGRDYSTEVPGHGVVLLRVR